jgi:hypothetical protein
MAGLDPAIHVFRAVSFKTWMPATSAGMTLVLTSFPRVPRGRDEAAAALVKNYRFLSFGGGFFGGGGRLGGGAARFGNPP